MTTRPNEPKTLEQARHLRRFYAARLASLRANRRALNILREHGLALHEMARICEHSTMTEKHIRQCERQHTLLSRRIDAARKRLARERAA